jgi:hypothetical protein
MTDLWKLPNDNQLFFNLWELAVWEHMQLVFKILIPCPDVQIFKDLKSENQNLL